MCRVWFVCLVGSTKVLEKKIGSFTVCKTGKRKLNKINFINLIGLLGENFFLRFYRV